ncbi:MAG: thiol oxidoreductase [Proteobacteria bacterium]|nr:thiol oxidoreductase [Pseudomonadota bacterium]
MNRIFVRHIVGVFLLSQISCSGGGSESSGSDFPEPQLTTLDLSKVPEISADRLRQGGETTVFDRTALSFENPAPNLSANEADRHFVGDANFAAQFVTAPSIENPGLGPLFNNNSCDACHTKNGRGQPIFGNSGLGSQALVRVSSTDGSESLPGGPRNALSLGTQIQDHATFGISKEADVVLKWETQSGTYADGENFELRKPKLDITLADGNKLPANIMTSMRTAPAVFGLGLLEAVPDAAIAANADPDDLNGDGISGRVNHVWDIVLQVAKIGRFGRKANSVNLLEQAAAAYTNDIGVDNPLIPATDGSVEIDGDVLTSAEFYTQTLAVPSAGNINDPSVKYGEKLFVGFKCASCHIPELNTAKHQISGLSNQRIFAYTDLLLHDMGQGLADGRADFEASGSEWKTQALWGIGITSTILSNTASYLHDGRARTLEEAILWHGGEALESRERFRQSSKADREALISFLRSL